MEDGFLDEAFEDEDLEQEEDNEELRSSTFKEESQKETKKHQKKKINIPKCFEGHDFYQILGVSKTATIDEINKGYRKMSLKHHPDRNQGNPQATEEFQYLAHIHETLTKDPRRRQMYDKHGDDGSDLSNEFMDAYEYWRSIFPEISAEEVDDYKTKYLGSEEEKDDFIAAFNEAKGNFYDMAHNHLFFTTSDSFDRDTELMKGLLNNPKINKKFIPNFQKSLINAKKKLLSEETKQQKQYDAVQNLAKTLGNATGKNVDVGAALQLIMSANKSKGSFLDSIAEKYASIAGKSKGKKRPVDINNDDEFNRYTEEVFGKSSKKSKK